MTPVDQHSMDIFSRLRRKVQYSLFRQHWNLAVTPYPASIVSGLEGNDRQRRALEELCWMAERRDVFAADPFIARDTATPDDCLIYYEHFPWKFDRGSINSVRFGPKGFGQSTVVLESPHHLSYPFIAAFEGGLALLPEHSAARRLSYYPLDSVGRIEQTVTVSELPLLDSTVVAWQARLWLFATHADGNDNSVLYIYHADTIDGPWAPHSQNPVKRDIANARPAGSFILHGGKLFRPAQDCTTHYGSGIIINEVMRLTADEFEERQVSEIRPLPGTRYDYGLHTISSADDLTVIDGARMDSSIHPWFDRFGRYFKP